MIFQANERSVKSKIFEQGLADLSEIVILSAAVEPFSQSFPNKTVVLDHFYCNVYIGWHYFCRTKADFERYRLYRITT